MTRAPLLVILGLFGGCWNTPAPHAPPPPPVAVDPDPLPPFRLALLAVADEERDTADAEEGRVPIVPALRIVDVAPNKIAVTRELADPPGNAVLWIGPDPLVYVPGLVGRGLDTGVDTFEPTFLTWHGFSPVAPIAWPAVAPPRPEDMSDDERTAFSSGGGKLLVIAHCAWWFMGAGEAPMACSAWQHARAWPLPVALLDDEPLRDDEVLEPTPPVALARIHVTIEDYLAHCRPSPADDDKITTSDKYATSPTVHPLVADPPIFRLDSWSGSGFGPGYHTTAIFEGCKRSQRFTDSFIGPHGEVVLAGRELTVYWHGKLAAHAKLVGDRVAFAPTSP